MKTLTKNSGRDNSSLSSWQRPISRFFRNDFLNLWDMDLMDTTPSINIREEKENYKIELAAPGLKKEDFKIEVDKNILTISSEQESENKQGGESSGYLRNEYNYSSFSRSLSLPENVDSDNIMAKYENGILLLTVPKKPEGKESGRKLINVG
jgi:HSP20 family protein